MSSAAGRAIDGCGMRGVGGVCEMCMSLKEIDSARVYSSIGASVRICGDSHVSILREHCTPRLVIM